jgi:pyridoxine kinase
MHRPFFLRVNSGHGRRGPPLRRARRGPRLSPNARALHHHHAQLVRSRVNTASSYAQGSFLCASHRTLTDIELKDLPSLRRAFKILHEEYHVQNVVISSIPLGAWLKAALPPSLAAGLGSVSSHLLCISSSAAPNSATLSTVHAQTVELLPGYFSGVGDLFSALLLAHYIPNGPPSVARAASQALTKTHAMLRLTYEHSETLPEDERQATDDEKDLADPLRKVRRMRGRELRLVQGQDILRGIGLKDIREMQPWPAFWAA